MINNLKLGLGYFESVLLPILIGLAVAFLTISSFYITNTLNSSFDVKWGMLPYALSLLLPVGCIAAYTAAGNISRLFQRKEATFIVLLIFGFQFTGLIPGKINTSDLFFLAVVPFWLLSVFVNVRYTMTWSALNFLNLALLAFGIISIAHGRVHSILTMLPLVKTVLFSFLILEMIREPEWIIYYIKALVVITAISAAIGIFQEIVFLGTRIILAFYDSSSLNLILERNSLGTFLRVPAFTGMHLYLANYLVISLLIGFNALLHYYSELKQKEKVALWVSMCLMSLALLLTFSKTNMFGLFVGMTISIVWKWRSYIIHLVAVALLLIVVAYISGIMEKVYDEILSQMELSGDLGGRMEMMREGIRGFLNKFPFIGAGAGLGKRYTENAMGWPVHNAFVLAADEVGIFGALTFISIFLYGFYRLLTTLPRVREQLHQIILKTLIVGLVALVVNIQFQPDFLSYYNWIYIGFVETTVIVFRNKASAMAQNEKAGAAIRV